MTKLYDVIDVMTSTGRKKGPENLLKDISSSNPSGAAGKAVTKICKNSKTKGRCTLIITVKDTVTSKLYMYKVTRDRVDKIVMRNGVPILYKYSQVVRAVKPEGGNQALVRTVGALDFRSDRQMGHVADLRSHSRMHILW